MWVSGGVTRIIIKLFYPYLIYPYPLTSLPPTWSEPCVHKGVIVWFGAKADACCMTRGGSRGRAWKRLPENRKCMRLNYVWTSACHRLPLPFEFKLDPLECDKYAMQDVYRSKFTKQPAKLFAELKPDTHLPQSQPLPVEQPTISNKL